MTALDVLAELTVALRSALLIGGVALTAVAALDWGVRTRRINPFSGVARFMRGRVEPRLAGVERQGTRGGGHSSSTPWWALAIYIVCAVLLLAGVDMLAALVRDAIVASSMGGTGLLLLAVRWSF